MIKNYLQIALRNLFRNKTYVLINLFGMGFALACCIVAFLNLDYKLRFDEHHHENSSSVYRINTIRETENGKEAWGATPLALGYAISQDVSGVTLMRLHNSIGIVKVDNRAFNEGIHFSDMRLLEALNFPLLHGDVSALNNDGTVVISEDTSFKYFGGENALDKEIIIIDEFKREKSYIVGAVTKRIPENTSIHFDVMVPINNLFEPTHFPENDWKADIQTSIFVELDEGYTPGKIDDLLRPYIAIHNSFRDDLKIARFYLQPFNDLAFTSDIDLSGWVRGRLLNRNAVGFTVTVTVFLSLLILLTACFNYINTSIAFSSNRLKEIGIRKVIGGTRTQLIKQFMGENLVLCFSSIVVGLLGAQFLIDAYNGMFDSSLDMRYVFSSRVLIFLTILPFVTAVIAGSYPAFFISKYQPVEVLKGKTKFATMGKFSKILLGSQFSFSCFALLMGIVLAQNAAYQQEVDFGYDLRKVAVTAVNNPQEFSSFYNAVVQNSTIENAAGSFQIIGESSEVAIKTNPDDVERKTRKLEVGNNYLNTLGIKLSAGRDFLEGSVQDMENAVIVNQKLLDELQWQDSPINKQIYIEEKAYTIIGVAQNHKEFGLLAEEPPCLFTQAQLEDYKYLSVNAPSDKVAEISNKLTEIWTKVNPDVPYNGFLQEMLIFKQLNMNKMLRNLCIFLAGVTLLMSAAGFFSIVSLTILKRTKEIGIRKVFGGSEPQMIQIISRGFIKLISIAFIIGSLLGYLLVDKVLFSQMYVYHIPLGIGAFLATFFIVTLVPMVTVGFKVYEAANANPVRTLKYE
ncbi:ABC transporter permease [Lunatibacter salilacus]|uniref:ABC transporter permease n=1 Tax=Lunatibacter salilacus TaxID=2483804 RepID=UPI00131D476C|nr:ABC transporter permease [Lunatibacter salilacus]